MSEASCNQCIHTRLKLTTQESMILHIDNIYSAHIWLSSLISISLASVQSIVWAIQKEILTNTSTIT